MSRNKKYAKLSILLASSLHTAFDILRKLNRNKEVTREEILDAFEKAIGNVYCVKSEVLYLFDTERIEHV
jgi:hypothetical protein